MKKTVVVCVVAAWSIGSLFLVATAQDVQLPNPSPAPPKLTIDQQRQVSRVVAAFRRARRDPAARVRALQEAMQLGPPAVAALKDVITAELDPRVKRYLGQFAARASTLAQQRIRQARPEEIETLRRTVLDLSKSEPFTKEIIVAKADPAMQRLREIFLIDAAEVLVANKSLQAERTDLIQAAFLWDKCAAFLAQMSPHEAAGGHLNFEQLLQREEQQAAALAMPMDRGTRGVWSINANVARQLDPQEARAIAALNLIRTVLGLQPLMIDVKLCDAARDHSGDMDKQGFFSHTSPTTGKETPWVRAKLFGTTAAGENIYTGTTDAMVVTNGWFHSPPHHKNMLGQYHRVGVGRSGKLFTQMFGR